jgi:hypothetical protein
MQEMYAFDTFGNYWKCQNLVKIGKKFSEMRLDLKVGPPRQ